MHSLAKASHTFRFSHSEGSLLFSRPYSTQRQQPDATPMQLALAWLIGRSPNILLIPGTSSLQHLHENLQASQLHIPAEVLANLNSIGKQEKEF
jgi:aryl-alcohol dehydrogenase-like predicted oxidoreductase